MAERHYFSLSESRFVFYDDACDAHIETRVSGGGTMAEPWVDRHWSVAEARKQLVCAQERGDADVIGYMRGQLQFAEDRAKSRWQDPDGRLPPAPRPRSEPAQIPPELALLLNPDLGQVAHVSRQAEAAARQAEQMAEEAAKMRQQAARHPYPVAATRPANRPPAKDRGRRFRFDEED